MKKEINLKKAMVAYKGAWRTWHREEFAELLKPIDKALEEVQTRARVRCLDAVEIIEALIDVEKKLDIPKKAMDGIVVDVDVNAQAFPGAYKGIPESTQFRATYKKDHWQLVSVYRDECRRPSARFVIAHTEASKQALIDRFTQFER